VTADPYQDLLARAQDQCIPIDAVWELTRRCNLACQHCYVCRDAAAAELTTDECLRILPQLAEAGTLFLVLTGGEPLLRADFFDIAAEARRYEFALRIFTNGMLVDAAAADRLAALSPLAVEVSVLGARPETHDFLTRKRGSYERAVRALGLLRERGVHTVAKTVIMDANVSEFDDWVRWAGQAADRYAFDLLVIPDRAGGPGPLQRRMTPEQLRQFYRAHLDGPLPAPPTGAPGDSPMCGAGRNTVAIGADGSVLPCIVYPETAGSLRDRSFTRIWQESPILRRIREIRWRDLRECATCADFHLCGRCPAVAGLEHGDVLGPSRAACQIAEAKKEAALAAGKL
jgi:radical SAM protein with 4Fe4S-binding SPASM domain